MASSLSEFLIMNAVWCVSWKKAREADTGALAESGSELDDVPDYLQRLEVLSKEALPEKLNRFLEYLNRSSDQGVTQLLAGIAEEVGVIEHRIADLNHTLAKVDFRKGRYLQLQPQKISHERVRALHAAMRKLRSAALKEDSGESHTVILDEAFSKSSPSAATRIIEALRIFGLHPIFVTPNKEIGLLKKHTRKVICVQRPGREASLASISWQKLEKLANPK